MYSSIRLVRHDAQLLNLSNNSKAIYTVISPRPERKEGQRCNKCMIRLLARLLIAILSPNNLLRIIFTPCRLIGVKPTRVPPNRKYNTPSSSSLGPDLATDATPQTSSFLRGPSPRRGVASDFQITSRRKGSPHTSREGRRLRPPARGAPP